MSCRSRVSGFGYANYTTTAAWAGLNAAPGKSDQLLFR